MLAPFRGRRYSSRTSEKPATRSRFSGRRIMETNWYYTQGKSDRLGPAAESEIVAKITSGQLRGRDLVWKEGMSEWEEIRRHPEFRSVRGSRAGVQVGSTIPGSLQGWMLFVAILTILAGVFYVLSCVGIIPGVLMIIAGTGLLQARSSLDTIRETVDPSWAPFFRGLNRFMVMTGLVFIVTMVFALVFFIITVAGSMAG